MKNGFTLIEMMVVLSIFTIMTGVVLANLPQFREKTALQLVAQKMSLTIREAQVYGVGVKSSGSGSNIFPSHGINFGPITLLSDVANKKSYVLFADKPTPTTPNNRYDVGSGCGLTSTECVTRYDLTGTVEITAISGCNPNCTNDLSSNGVNILFKRPKTEANFLTLLGGSLDLPASYIQITLESSRSHDQRYVQVWNTGQISVKIP